MEIKTIIDCMKKLKVVYADKFSVNNEIIDVWYERFKDCRDDWFTEAVGCYIDNSVFPPVIANIRESYREVEERKKARVTELERIYNHICSIYPGGASAGDDCRKEFRRLTKDRPIDVAESIARQTEIAVKRLESGEGYISLTEYLKGIK